MNVKFYSGLKSQYLALTPPRNPAGLYFCTDTRELFKGDLLLTDGVRVISSYNNLPPFTVAAEGILYFTDDTKSGYLLNDTRDGWIQVVYGVATDINAVPSDKINELVPTVGAVINALNAVAPNIPIATNEIAGKVKASAEVLVAVDGTMSIGSIGMSKIEGLTDVLSNIYTKTEVDSLIQSGGSSAEIIDKITALEEATSWGEMIE